MFFARAGVWVDGQRVAARHVIIAMGPWSADAAEWVPGLPRIGGQKAHSILMRPSRPVGPDCLFTQFVTSSGARAWVGPSSLMLLIVFPFGRS